MYAQDNFDIQEFIGAISEKLIVQSKEDTGRMLGSGTSMSPSSTEHRTITAFDPNPFIRTFESSVDTLLAIRKDVQTKQEAMEVSLRSAEVEFSRKLADLNTNFEVGVVTASVAIPAG